MRARSAVFDLYGDHLAARSGWAPVAAVVSLTGACGIASPATRTALHRMVAQGWLEHRAMDGLRGYAATPAAINRLDLAHARIYAPRPPAWDGRWHMMMPQLDSTRAVRERAISALAYLGYGRFGKDSFLSPWRSTEAREVLADMGVAYTDIYGPSGSAPHELAAKVWDLDALSAQYQDFARTLPAPEQLADLSPHDAYPRRTDLVHRWRTFLFLDPGLPREALPQPWPGQQARADFLAAAAALAPAASRFIDLTLSSAGAPWAADSAGSRTTKEHRDR